MRGRENGWKFVIHEDKSGQHRFNLQAPDGEVILSSEGYTSLERCTYGIESVRTNAMIEARYHRTQAESGQYIFLLMSAINQIIGTSEPYTTPAELDNCIESVKENAPTAGLAWKT